MSEPDPPPARARDLPGLLSDGRLNAPWLRDPALSPVFTSIERAGFTVRAVGGAVRDALRGASDQSATTDVDLATNALPSETQAAAEAAGLKSVPTGIAHGTVTVISDGTPFEVTTLRTDVKTDGRHAEVAFTADWTADAQRRDFTINAIYCDQNGALFDPVGGMADLSSSNLRFIGDAATRIGEDYLRVLRFYRFLAQIPALSTDAAAWPAIEGARHGLALLSAERIHIELRKLLIADGAVAAIDLMRQHGTLAAVLKRAPSPEKLALLIDIERALSERDSGTTPTGPVFGGHADERFVRRLFALVIHCREDVDHVAVRLRLSNETAKALHAANGAAVLLKSAAHIDGHSVRKAAWRFGIAAALTALAVTFAGDRKTRVDDLVTYAQELNAWGPPAMPVLGRDLIEAGMARGPALGQTLKQLEGRWIDSDFTLSKEDLLACIDT